VEILDHLYTVGRNPIWYPRLAVPLKLKMDLSETADNGFQRNKAHKLVKI
jgi:hypothetical protein